MRRIISCGTHVPGCAFVAHGRDGTQVVRRLTEHMSMIHGLDPLSGEMQTWVQSFIEAESIEVRPRRHA